MLLKYGVRTSGPKKKRNCGEGKTDLGPLPTLGRHISNSNFKIIILGFIDNNYVIMWLNLNCVAKV